MKYVEARISEEAALRFFDRRRLGNLYGLLRRRPVLMPSGKTLPCVERIWMPYYLVSLRVRAAKRGSSITTAAIEAYSGYFALFKMHDDLIEGQLDEDSFVPELTPEAAEAIARKKMLHSILSRRSKELKPFIEETVGIDVFYYPFWVYYFLRHRKYLDIQIQDALSGERGGNRNRMGILNAFAAKAAARHEISG